jgi:hypothetical protein
MPTWLGVAEDQFLVAEDKAVFVLERLWKTDAGAVDEGAVPASQIDKGEGASIPTLDERVESRDRTAVQKNRATGSSADGPGLAVAERKPAAQGFHEEVGLGGQRGHVSSNVTNGKGRSTCGKDVAL